MSARAQTCYTLICDSCKEQAYEGDPGCEYHFESPDALRFDARECGDWTRDGDRDLCPSCTCKHAGHRQKADSATGFVYCTRCDETLVDEITPPVNPSRL